MNKKIVKGDKKMIKKKAVIVNKMGLHARPAYYFVEIAQEFESEITYTANGQIRNAKSIIDVLSSCIECGKEIELIVEGSDEREAVNKMITEIAAGLGEE